MKNLYYKAITCCYPVYLLMLALAIVVGIVLTGAHYLYDCVKEIAITAWNHRVDYWLGFGSALKDVASRASYSKYLNAVYAARAARQ